MNSTYPIYAHGDIARNAAEEIGSQLHTPPEMNGTVLISAMSASVQAGYRVQRLNGIQSACSVSTLLISSSGGRKTTLEKQLFAAHHQFDEACSCHFTEQISVWKADHSVWSVRQRGLAKKLEQASKNGDDPQEIDSIEAELWQHQKVEPEKPRRTRLLYSDVTPSSHF